MTRTTVNLSHPHRQNRTATYSHHSGMTDQPFGAILIGVGLLFFALWGISVQLTTSEAWFTGSAVGVSIAPHFSILAQPIDFFNGALSGSQMQAFTYAWGTEVIQFFFSTGLAITTMRHNRVASWICIIGCIAVMTLDSVADYKFNAAANGWQQLGFTLIVFMMAFGLTYYALYLIVIKGIVGFFR